MLTFSSSSSFVKTGTFMYLILIPFLPGFTPKGELDALHLGDIANETIGHNNEKKKLSNIICKTIEPINL
jgi:hypothetical protein